MKLSGEHIERYLQDESNLKSTGISGVCMPGGAADLSFFLKHNTEPFTVYGGGTGITGGATANSGILISTENMDRISLDARARTISAGAGTRLNSLYEAAGAAGLWYPAGPTEKTATIGGNAATNAWGAGSYKYGSIRNFIIGLEIVTPKGDFIEFERGQFTAKGSRFRTPLGSFEICPLPERNGLKSSAGLYMREGMDLIDLFIGSEGILGVITGLKLKLLDAPVNIHGFMVPFDGEDEALSFIGRMKEVKDRYMPLSIEYMDADSVMLLAKKEKKLEKTGVLVFIELEETKGVDVEVFSGIMEAAGADIDSVSVSSSPSREGFIWKVRESLPQQVNEIIRHNRMRKISTDFSVADEKAGDMIELYRSALERTRVRHVLFGHAGNNNLHINFMPENDSQAGEAMEIYDYLASRIGAMGGSISAEHGIGKLKKKYLRHMFDEKEITGMKKVRDFFDPEGICCPGTMLD
ncbi:MAG TPA: FAD-binding oxidoreductase [Candidatus Goldiibacteriota bacterium]|nr:FAD-binding oxidoreductase [Candidatus Goldiibacteriota bacterium]